MTKEQDRAELHRTIWNIAKDLRGNVDAWYFKSYVLGMLFYRFISENLTNYINKIQQVGIPTFDSQFNDEQAERRRKDCVQGKGFFILPSELFKNIQQRVKNDPNLNQTLKQVFINIENSALGTPSEDDSNGLFVGFDVNSTKLGVTVAKRNEKLVKILASIAGLNLGSFAQNNIDAFCDAYEFLMTMLQVRQENLAKKFLLRKRFPNCLRVYIQPNGTDIEEILPPISLLTPSGKQTKKRETVIEKLTAFLNIFKDLI